MELITGIRESTMKKDRIEKLEEGLQEVKELVKEFKSKNGNASCRVLNKDILFWLLTKQVDDDKRIAKLEAYTKILLLLVLATYGITIAL